MSYYSGLSVSQSLFNRAITSLYAQAVASEEISRATTDLQQQQTILQVYQAYYALLRAERNLGVAREDLEYNRALLRQVNTLHSLGKRARVDVLRQESAVAQSEQRLISAVNDRARGMADLNYLMGQSPTGELSIVDDLGYEPQQIRVESALELALSEHPSLRQAVLGITVAETGLQSAKAARVPSMNLSGNYSWRGTSYTDFTDAFSKNYTWSVGVGLYVPIFDRLQTKLNVQRARIDLAGAKADRDAAVLGIERDVHAAILELQEADQMLQTAQRAVALSEEALRLSEERYQLGAGSLLEVNASRYDLMNAQYLEVQALFTLKVATAGLEFAMGRLMTGTLLERGS
jgi:outer membrane protein